MLILDKITVSCANLAPLSTRSMDFNTRMPHSQYVRREGVSVFLGLSPHKTNKIWQEKFNRDNTFSSSLCYR